MKPLKPILITEANPELGKAVDNISQKLKEEEKKYQFAKETLSKAADMIDWEKAGGKK